MLELTTFNDVATRLTDSFFKTIEVPPPPIIYHYTNDVGLRGILETGKLWLTDMFNLNDPSELSHGLSHVVNILNNKAVNGPPESQVFAEAFEAFLKRGGYQQLTNYFVLSFSRAGDDLGQWRAYADNGRGYVLGFDAVELVTAFMKKPGDNATFSITYNDGKCIELHEQIVDLMFHLISLAHRQGHMGDLYAFLAIHALRTALVFKHEAYKNEKEFRFLEMHGADVPEVKLKTRSYSLLRYREFDWRSAAPGALKQIVVGPAANYDRAFKFATDCLCSFHGTMIRPRRSKIPYAAT